MKNPLKNKTKPENFPGKENTISIFEEHRAHLVLNNVLVAGIDGYWEIDVEKNIIIFSDKWLEMLGYNIDKKEKNDVELKALIHPEDIPRLEKIQEDIYQGTIHHYKTIHRVKNNSGNYVWLLSRGNVTERNSKNLPTKIVGIDTDITEQKLLENALRQNEKTYQLLAKNIPKTSLLFFDKKLRFVLAEGEENWNNKLDKKLIEGKTIYEIFQQKDINLFEPIYLKALQGQTTEFEHEFKGNAYHRIIQPMMDGKGEIIGGLVISTNITKNKRLESAMVKNQQMHKLLTDNFNQAVLIFEDERIESISPSFQILFDLDNDSPLHTADFLKRVHQDDIATFNRDYQIIANGGKKEVISKIRLISREKGTRYIKYVMTRETNSNGIKGKIVLIAEDISIVTFNEELNQLYIKALDHISEIESITCRIYDLTDEKNLYCTRNFNEFWHVKSGMEIKNEHIYHLLGNDNAFKINQKIARGENFSLTLGKNNSDFSEISIYFYPSIYKPEGYFIELAR